MFRTSHSLSIMVALELEYDCSLFQVWPWADENANCRLFGILNCNINKPLMQIFK
jgi:hypothetical protein